MPHDDLMDRLAAADPLPDAEHLTPAAQLDADALLARLLATPPGDRAAGRRRGRRPAVVAAGLAAAAVAVFAVVNVADLGAPGTSVEQAVAAKAVAAATEPDSVYHVVQIRGTRGLPDVRAYVEGWYASDGRMHEKAYAVQDGGRGALRGEVAGRRPGDILTLDAQENRLHGGGIASGSGDAPAIDPASDPGGTLRALEAQGRLRVAGTTEVDGKRAYRLVSGPFEGGSGREEEIEYVVDAETFLPLTLRWTEGNELEHVAEFLVYERLPLDAASRALLVLDAPAGATCAPGAEQARDLGFDNPCARR